jgi:rod shape-determining protein MreC
LQHLDEVLVITSLEAHLSAQQMADLKTSEELKGAEVAADAERKKAAAEMAERLPSLKDPSAPDAGDGTAADGKTDPAVPPVRVIPKPLPAKHPDRFSPGGAAVAPVTGAGAGTAHASDGSAAASTDAPVTKPVTKPPPKPQTGPGVPPANSKPNAPKAGSPKFAHPAGRVE